MFVFSLIKIANWEQFPVFSDAITYWLTYSMEKSPSWEANRFSASQEIPHILWNPQVHYRIHKFAPPVPPLAYTGSQPTTYQ